MTCIVGLECPDGKVIIGGDSAGVAGWSLDVRADEKVFTRGPFAFGFTTSFRMGQLLRYATSHELDAEPGVDGHALDAYMATTFVDAVRDCLKRGGYAKVENHQEEGGTFLVGIRGRLYCVESDFQVGRSAAGFAAVGCGAQIALGAMWAHEDVDDTESMDPEARVLLALGASERFNAGVRGPFLTVTT